MLSFEKARMYNSRDVCACHHVLYLHEFKDLFLRASLLQEEAVRVRALQHAPRLQQLQHTVLNEARVWRSALSWGNTHITM